MKNCKKIKAALFFAFTSAIILGSCSDSSKTSTSKEVETTTSIDETTTSTNPKTSTKTPTTTKIEETKYLIQWVNYDGTVLDTKTIEEGVVPQYEKETPTKESDNTYNYTFIGWDSEVVAATNDKTYKAEFKE